MKKTILIFLFIFAILFSSWFFLIRGGWSTAPEIIYRTEKAVIGSATMSFTATGILQPLTVVDVKSKAGGEVVQLSVEEGTEVEPGQLIAVIDPRDTKAAFDQVDADLTANLARAEQSRLTAEIESKTRAAAVLNAEAALETAKLRVSTLEARAAAQPQLTRSNVAQAQANYDVAVRALDTLQRVTIPQSRAQVKGEYDRAKAELDAAKANYDRKQVLLEKGYVPASEAETARTQYEAAVASNRNAKERLDRIDEELRLQVETANHRVAQAQAALDLAKANQIEVGISKRDLDEAKQAVAQAKANLETAKANLRQVEIRKADVRASQSAIVRSRVSRDNAKVQLDSTTVVAPRKGVVTIKYIEQGTIIPPGTSTFAQGTSIVQIADTTRMYVEVLVDEADVGRVEVDQAVNVTLESARRTPMRGKVSRVNPAATTASGVTSVKVRVEVEAEEGVKLMPGLNASCEFIIKERHDVLVVPNPAIQEDGDKKFVEVMVAPETVERRDVQIGAVGNMNTEILSGVKEGEDVVVSKIDRALIEEQTQRMEDAATQRNPFSGGPKGR